MNEKKIVSGRHKHVHAGVHAKLWRAGSSESGSAKSIQEPGLSPVSPALLRFVGLESFGNLLLCGSLSRLVSLLGPALPGTGRAPGILTSFFWHWDDPEKLMFENGSGGCVDMWKPKKILEDSKNFRNQSASFWQVYKFSPKERLHQY